MEGNNALDYIASLNESTGYKEHADFYQALSDFMVDYDFIKDIKKLTQKEIAVRMGTTQSAVSRMESMKTNPTYKQLEKLTEAIEGKLLITPIGDMTVQVPYDLQDKVRELAASQGSSTTEYLKNLLRSNIELEVERNLLTQDS